MNELISVIVPVFNVERYLSSCLTSIVSQTYVNLEIILINDGSSDSSAQICEQFKNKDDRIIVVNQQNQGVSAARNAGLNIARGGIISFIDSDDFIEKDMIEYMYRAMVQANVDLVTCGLDFIYPKKRVAYMQFDNVIVNTEELIYNYISQPLIFSSPWNKLYRKSLFDGLEYPVEKIYEDRYLSLDIFLRANKALFLPDIKYHYVQHEGSIVNSDFHMKRLSFIDIAEHERELLCNNQNKHVQEFLLTNKAEAITKVMHLIAVSGQYGKFKSTYDALCVQLDFELGSIIGKIPKSRYNCYNKYSKHKFFVRCYYRLRHLVYGVLRKKL